MILDIFLLIFLFYLSIPTVVGYFAYAYGRSFWGWFWLSCFLPIFSHILLYILVSRDTRNHRVLSPAEERHMQQHIDNALKSKPKTYF